MTLHKKYMVLDRALGLRTDGGPFEHQVRDYLGSSRMILSEDGDLTGYQDYSPYGEIREHKIHGSNKLYFASTIGDRHGDHQMNQMRTRHYAPAIGRFFSPDLYFIERPEDCLASSIECNLYSYGRNNPIQYVDPTGRYAETAVDVASVGAGIHSISQWNAATPFWFKVVDVAGLILDGAAAITPLIPGGVGLGIKAARGADKVGDAAGAVFDTGKVSVKSGRAGKQARLREMMNDPKVSAADRGWLRNDQRHIEFGNKKGLRLPRNGRKSPGRKATDKGYELAHPHTKPASQGNSYDGSLLKNHADHKVETRLHRHRY